MAGRKREQPTKAQAVGLGVVVLLGLSSAVTGVVVEGRPASFFYWVFVAVGIALLIVAAWLYRRALKKPERTR